MNYFPEDGASCEREAEGETPFELKRWEGVASKSESL